MDASLWSQNLLIGSLGAIFGRIVESIWFQDLLILVAFGFIVWLVVHGSRSERWRQAWVRLRRDRSGIAAGVVIGLYLGIGMLEMIQIPHNEFGSISILGWLTRGVAQETSYSAPWASTSLSITRVEKLHGWHLLGTDALGKDTFVQTLRACRTALLIGGITSAIYVPLGTLFGIFAGYFRGWIDDVIQYFYTVIYSIPEILLLISLLLILGKSVTNMSIALAITAWVSLCRLIRGETMRQAERPYVAAARALGQSHWKIITQHLLPNVMHLVLISFVLGFSHLVLAEAILSYLGVGSPIGTPSWGSMIDGARGEFRRYPLVWWNLISATVALFGLVLSLNIFGDSLRRAFDPKRG